jgi:hypothetical protein
MELFITASIVWATTLVICGSLIGIVVFFIKRHIE